MSGFPRLGASLSGRPSRGRSIDHNQPLAGARAPASPSWPGLTGPSAETFRGAVCNASPVVHDQPLAGATTPASLSWPGLTGPSAGTFRVAVCITPTVVYDQPLVGMRVSHVQLAEQILPSRVVRIDQVQLPGPWPVFEALFPLDRGDDVLVPLHVNDSRKFVALRECRSRALAVFPCASADIVGHAGVKRPKRPVCHDVDPPAHSETMSQAWLNDRERRFPSAMLRSAISGYPGVRVRPGMVRAASDPRGEPEDDGGRWLARGAAFGLGGHPGTHVRPGMARAASDPRVEPEDDGGGGPLS